LSSVGHGADEPVMARDERGNLAREIIRGMRSVRRRDVDPYAGADQANAGRILALLWLLSGALTLAFFPLDPPTEAIGSAGWAVAGAVVVASVAGALRLLRRDPPLGFNDLLALSYLGLAQVALLQWLGGGVGSSYQELYLLWLGSAMGIHPPRRALAFLAVTVLVAFSPLAYDRWSSAAAAEIATNVLLWTVLGGIILALMVYVRAQRVRLRAGEEHAQQLARADPLTGLGNRRAFDEALAAEVARARRADSTVSVAVLDLDRFKELNDQFGHLEGDRVLRLAANAVDRALRGGDRSFRWGGDEFALLLPDTAYDGAEEAMERIASEVMNSCSSPDGRSLTISWGVAELLDETTPSELLAQADLALMVHKRRKSEAESTEPLTD
jgi:diguanylate cyclase (GGDEF)-like protein